MPHFGASYSTKKMRRIGHSIFQAEFFKSAKISVVLFFVFFEVFKSNAGWSDERVFFPFGVYDKSDIEVYSEDWIVYYDKLLDLLVDHSMNTVITLPYWEPSLSLSIMDRAHAHSIKVVMSVGNPLNINWDLSGPEYRFHRVYSHPSIIAYKIGDEPKSQENLDVLADWYAAIRAYHSKPIVTALVGESMTGSPADIGMRMWTQLGTEIRFARHYPMRRTYDLVDWYAEKMIRPLEEWAELMETIHHTPWWFIVETFGTDIEKNQNHDAVWRFPTRRELNAMVHIALAFGARGVLGYALQDHGKIFGLVDNQLRPRKARDGSIPLLQFQELGALVQRNSELLLGHRRDSFNVSVDNPRVLAVPRYDPRTGTKYIYLVNKDTESSISATIRIPASLRLAMARDVYTGQTYSGKLSGNDNVFYGELKAGGGQLWQLSTAPYTSGRSF